MDSTYRLKKAEDLFLKHEREMLEFLGSVVYEERKKLILQQDHDDLMEMLYGAKK